MTSLKHTERSPVSKDLRWEDEIDLVHSINFKGEAASQTRTWLFSINYRNQAGLYTWTLNKEKTL